MKNFHFGHGIFVTLTLFILFLVTMLVKSRQMDHTLVSEDYYAGDLAYQKTYNKLNNALIYRKDFNLKSNEINHTHYLEFNDSNSKTGIIKLYRPSDSSLDFSVPFNSEKGVEIISKISPGKWTVTVEWKEGDIDFQVTKDIFIGA